MRRLRSCALAALIASTVACSSASPDAGPSPGTDLSPDASRPADGAVEGAPEPDAVAEAGTPADVGGGGTSDASTNADADASDGDAGCAVSGAPGECLAVAACAALTDHTSFPGYCPGPASVECCIVTPSTADNPPVPVGWMLMAQSQVTPAMTTWAVAILDDPTTYPMFATAMQTFGTLMVLARVEWHPPDFQNSAVHRGVTLYVPG